MKKRVLAIAMTLAMTLSLLPVSALATETGETPEEETSTVNSIQETNSSENAENQDQELTADVEIDEDTQVTEGDSMENPVAKIGDTEYETLEAAIASARDGETVTLLNNVVLDPTYSVNEEPYGDGPFVPAMTITQDIVLNLDNHKICWDTSKTSSEDIWYTLGFFTVDGANVTLRGGENGTIDAEANYSNSYGINIINGGAVTVENGVYTGATTAIQVDKGTLTIIGGTFKQAKTIAEVAPEYAKYIINCIDPNYKNGTAVIYVRGGTFIGTNPAESPEGADTSYVPGDCEVIKKEEGIYTVQPMDDKLVVTPTTENGNITASLEGSFSNNATIYEENEDGEQVESDSSDVTSNELTVDLTTAEGATNSATLNVTAATAATLSEASSMTVKTDVGTVELDSTALKKVSNTQDEVSITVTKNNASEANVAASYTVEVKSGSTDLLPDGESDNGTITLTLPVPTEKQDQALYVWYAVEQSNSVMYVNRVGTYNPGSASVSFEVNHLSRYDLLSANPTTTAVASITKDGETTYYDSLQAAVDAVTTTEQTTIKLLKSTSGAGVKVDGTVKRNLTFDMGGYTYTITSGVGSSGTETNGFQLIKDNNITITNGTITAAPAEGQQVKILIQNYSNLTLENVVLDGRGMTDYSGLNYTLSNNNGEITLKSGTVIQARTDEIAMDVCWAASYQNGARVTVEEGAEIQGTVELGLWGQDAYSDNQSVLTVNGGTITGEVKLDSSISEDDISETIEALKTNVTINGGTFGSNVDAYVDSTDDAKAHIARNGQYTYYETVQDALNAAQPGDSVVALNSAPDSTLCTVTLNYGYNSNGATIQVASGTKISLPDPGTRTGYTFNGWYNGSSYVGRGGTEVTITSDITYTADWTRNQTDRPSSGSSGSSSDRTYSIDVDVTGSRGGSVTLSPTRASAGTRVTITVRPNSGYELDELTVLDEDGDEVRLTQRTDTTYTFHMPGGKVTVEASFVREGGQTQIPQTTFADVPVSAWYCDAVEYVYENGLMSGVSGGRFAPNDTLTRAMLVQTLYAMEGRPAAASAGFADVASGDWYASAVNWAAANGVVSGVSETGFGPNNALTREQLALILYRFAQYKGYDVTGTSDLAAYADGSSVSGWAAEAMSWAVNAGLISGVGGNQIAPTGTATRAQVAQILMNFCENVAH